jgi:hypothetical protein
MSGAASRRARYRAGGRVVTPVSKCPPAARSSASTAPWWSSARARSPWPEGRQVRKKATRRRRTHRLLLVVHCTSDPRIDRVVADCSLGPEGSSGPVTIARWPGPRPPPPRRLVHGGDLLPVERPPLTTSPPTGAWTTSSSDPWPEWEKLTALKHNPDGREADSAGFCFMQGGPGGTFATHRLSGAGVAGRSCSEPSWIGLSTKSAVRRCCAPGCRARGRCRSSPT